MSNVASTPSRRFSGRYEPHEGEALTLHVDVDGPGALAVVSGRLRDPAPREGDGGFIGRVAARTRVGHELRLAIDGFSLPWPGHDAPLVSLDLRLVAHGHDEPPTAEACLHAADGRQLGPLPLRRASACFREVVIDIDAEPGAGALPTWDTHGHPERPERLRQRELTMQGVYAEAGIELRWAEDAGDVVPAAEAGDDGRWSFAELHDSMTVHWDAYANVPQWKLWFFLGRQAESDLGGIMFDADIDEPGGVDRQGVALFTQGAYFHDPEGALARNNPPADASARRELFFNAVHELGHAFNLAHPFEARAGTPWQPPAWFRHTRDPEALTWMNYPNRVRSDWTGLRTEWFYRHFRFRFDPWELLFLRHAPASAVEPGNAAWAQNHGRVAERARDPRLELAVAGGKSRYELGEPVLLELCLRNVAPAPVRVFPTLDPSEGTLEVTIVMPGGHAQPFVPIDRTRRLAAPVELSPGGTLHASLDVTIGRLGFPFKAPGRYELRVAYLGVEGAIAVAAVSLEVAPGGTDEAVVRELFDARVGRVLYVDGTRVLGDVNEKLTWVRERLGPRHPVSLHVRAVQFLGSARTGRVVGSVLGDLRRIEGKPDEALQLLRDALTVEVETALATFGPSYLRELVVAYVDAALAASQPEAAREALRAVVGALQRHGAAAPILADLERRREIVEHRGRP